MSKRLLGTTVEEKLVLNSHRDGGCLRWAGAHTPKGYGHVSVDGRARPVHVVAHEMWIGPVPPGHEVDHVHERGCRFRDCIEPGHLEAVTHAENVRRQLALVTHCAQGHEFTAENINIYVNKKGYTTRRCRECNRAWCRARKARIREAASRG